MFFFLCVFTMLFCTMQAQTTSSLPTDQVDAPAFLRLTALKASVTLKTQNNESTDTSFCDASSGTWVMPYEQYKQGLLNACSRDAQCSNFFYQPPGRQDMRRFEFLLGSTMMYLRGDILRPLREAFCLHASSLSSHGKDQVQGQTQNQGQSQVLLEAAGYAFAIHTILARRHFDQPVCGVHFVPRVDAKTGATDCVLASDQSTQSCASNYTFLLIVMAVGLAAMLFLNFTLCYINIKNLLPGNSL